MECSLLVCGNMGKAQANWGRAKHPFSPLASQTLQALLGFVLRFSCGAFENCFPHFFRFHSVAHI